MKVRSFNANKCIIYPDDLKAVLFPVLSLLSTSDRAHIITFFLCVEILYLSLLTLDPPPVFYRTELSVVSGGTKLGWSSDSAVIIWRRMLGALGDINKIKNPGHHAQVMKCLWDLWQQLAKVSSVLRRCIRI